MLIHAAVAKVISLTIITHVICHYHHLSLLSGLFQLGSFCQCGDDITLDTDIVL